MSDTPSTTVKCARCGEMTDEPRDVIGRPYCPNCSEKDWVERLDFEIEIRSQS